MPNLSVIVPASRNTDDIELKFSQLRLQLDALEAGFDDYEILLIDIKNQLGQNKLTRNQLASQYDVQTISLDGTHDTTAALSAGIDLARAKFLLTVDLTCEYPLETIGLLIDQLRRADLVVARFRRRRWAKICHRLMCLPRWALLGLEVREPHCLFWTARKEAVEGLPPVRGLYRYLANLATCRGYRVGELPLDVALQSPQQEAYDPFELFVMRWWTNNWQSFTVHQWTDSSERLPGLKLVAPDESHNFPNEVKDEPHRTSKTISRRGA